MDLPHDKLHYVDWHQDRSYFPQNRDGLHGLVCWIPLTDITEEMGAIHISPKSHLAGNLKLTQMLNLMDNAFSISDIQHELLQH